MVLALSLGRRGLGRTWPNPAVGAVMVKNGEIVGRGWTQPGGRPHAEIEALRNRVHLLRAHSDAIMIGIGTVLADDPVLTCRLPGMDKMSPTRVVLDSGLRLPLGSRLVQSTRDTPLWVFCEENASAAAEAALRAQGVDVIRIMERDGLAVVLSALGSRGITRLMVEGGPTLAMSLIARDF